MFRKRVINLSNKYVAVSKVRFQLSHLDCPRNFVDSIKTPSSVKQISSAAERLDFQTEPRSIAENPTDFHHSLNGPYRDKFLDSQQYPSRSFHGEISNGTQRNPVEFSRGQFPSDSTSGFYRGNFQQNVDGIYRGNPGEEQKMNPVWRNGISDNSYREYPKEVQYNHNGYHRESSSNYQQNPTWGYSGNNGTQNQNGSYSEDHRHLQQVPNGVYRENPSEARGSLNGYYRQNVVQPQQNSNGFHTENIGEFQQNVSGSQREMVHSQNLSNVNSNGNTSESNENNQYRGTIDELDDFCKEGKMKEAVEVLDLLEKQHIDVDLPRYLQLMQACGEAKALQEAKSVHNHLMKSKTEIKVSIYNKILEMYSKCGSMSDAYELFEKMPERNLTSWDTMITWLAKNGLGEDAIDLFTRFKEAGLRPDGEMFIAIFSACSVLCDIDEGMLHFESMRKDYGIIPSMEHYVSVVEMLGSTGYLDEAMEFIENMPFEPSADVWEALMNLCRVNGNIALGDRCAEFIELLDPSRLTDQSKAGLVPVKASDLAKEKEKKKLSTQNLLEVRSRVHEYRAGDTSHPEKDKIYALLKGMSGQMREAGYVPETRFVLHDIDQEGKEEALLSHSERLAVAYGLISSPSRSPIRIIKNLRVCGDCHSALKIISKLVGRELIIRDAKRFHHFKDGLCSCRDYW